MPEEPTAIAKGYTALLEGHPDADPAWRDAACLAAGLNFALVGRCDVADGFQRARELLDSGAAGQLWEKWIASVSPGATAAL
jgi:anthranilate phosphoribosyltransferase